MTKQSNANQDNGVLHQLEHINVFRRSDGRLAIQIGNEKTADSQIPVQVVSAFPWTLPFEYISIRDDKGKEICMIENMEDVPQPARVLIKEELEKHNFMPRITAIESINKEMELFHWKVMTNVGPRRFLTHRHDQLRYLPGGRLLIRDVGNDLYLIENPKDFDADSLKLLWVYLD